jgi:hypothetical protein
MTRHVVSRKRLGLALFLAVLFPAAASSARAQRLAGADDQARGNLLQQGGMPLPQGQLQGAWGEVIMANAKWVVVQNQAGQQFPISNDAIGQFLIRWPSSLDALGPQSVVEAFGRDFGSNVLQTDHVDVFEGPDRNLVSPLYVRILPNNRVDTALDPAFYRFMSPFDIGAQNLLYGWAYPVNPGQTGIPAFLHVVGTAIATAPLRLFVPGNNFATVFPDSQAALAVFQITQGDTSFAEKGDLIYMQPIELTTRTVRLSQAVLYKKIPVREFRQP